MDQVVRRIVSVLCEDGRTTAAKVLNIAWSREMASRAALESPPPSDSRTLDEARADGRREAFEEAAQFAEVYFAGRQGALLSRGVRALPTELRSLSTPTPKKGTR